MRPRGIHGYGSAVIFAFHHLDSVGDSSTLPHTFTNTSCTSLPLRMLYMLYELRRQVHGGRVFGLCAGVLKIAIIKHNPSTDGAAVLFESACENVAIIVLFGVGAVRAIRKEGLRMANVSNEPVIVTQDVAKLSSPRLRPGLGCSRTTTRYFPSGVEANIMRPCLIALYGR